MAKPSGLLNGRGCYDSIRKCENDSSVFLSIRNYGTPFIVEQRQAIARARSADVDPNHLENQVKEKFMAGNFTFLIKFVKSIFMVLFFPFYLVFNQLPRLLIAKVITPIYKMLQKVWQMIVPPCVRVFLAVYQPIASLFKKIVRFCLKLIGALKPPLLAFLRVLGQCVGLFKPLLRIFPKKNTSNQTFFQKCKYGVKISFIWFKLLIGYGFKQAKDQVKAKSIVGQRDQG